MPPATQRKGILPANPRCRQGIEATVEEEREEQRQSHQSTLRS